MKRLPSLAPALAFLSVAACDRPDAAPTPSEPLASEAAAENLVVRRVGTDIRPLDVFPEGRRLAIEDTLGNLQMQEIGSGFRAPLTTDGSWADQRWPETARVSPDGTQVAYTWYNGSTIDLRVVNADGTGQRTLAQRDWNNGWLDVADWSPDGRSLLVRDGEFQEGDRLLAVDVESGSATTVYDFGWRGPGLPRISPSGDQIAVSLLSVDDAGSRDLYVLNLASGALEKVVDLSESVELADWAPGGDALYFVTQRDGLTTLWRQRLEEGGAPAAEAERLQSDLDHLSPIGYAGGGLFFWEFYLPWSVQHAQLTAGSDGIQAPPAALVEGLEGIRQIAWSPDAQDVAYQQHNAFPFWNTWHLVVRSRAGEERVFEPSFTLANFIDWRSDGLFVAGRPEGQSQSYLYRVDFESGRFVQVEDLGDAGAPRYSADGRYRLFARRGPPPQLVVLDGETGVERVIMEGDDYSRWVAGGRRATARLSPDGQHVAFLSVPTQNRLTLVSTRTGESRVIYTSSGDRIRGGSMAWTPDSQAIVILEEYGSPLDAPTLFRRVSLDGTATDVLDPGGQGRNAAVWFALSPDGRHLAYSAAMEGQDRSGVWVVEGLEP